MKTGRLGTRFIVKAALFGAPALIAAGLLFAAARAELLPAPPLPVGEVQNEPQRSRAPSGGLLAVIETRPAQIVFGGEEIGGEVRVLPLGIRMFDGTWSSLDEDDAIAFSSSNAAVVSVTADGLVAAVGPGAVLETPAAGF